MPAETRRLFLAAARTRKLPALEPATLALVPYPNSLRHPDPALLVVAARADACPIRDASAASARIDAALPPDELRQAVAECARLLAGEGRLELHARLRVGSGGFSRRLLAWLFRLPPPPSPEAVARLLFDHGFDRIEQDHHGGTTRFRARRLPGRTPQP
jgi:hypothetical protein